MGSGCPTCAKHGFDARQPSVLYFITHKGFASRKIGITNVGARRLSVFKKKGWNQALVVERQEGFVVRDVETAVLSWLRNEHALPQHLGPEEMGRQRGWTETFSEEGPSNSQVIDRIKAEFQRIEENTSRK
jgi:hypothetical protein